MKTLILNYKKIIAIGLLLFFANLYGCKKFIDVASPNTSINAGNVYTNDRSAAAVLTGIYATMSQKDANPYSDVTGISVLPALSADELSLYNLNDPAFSMYYTNSLTALKVTSGFWSSLYSYIYKTNSAIEGLTASTTLSPPIKKQLLGEAKFIRAFCYFYLVNLYGDVPLTTSSDFQKNSLLSRTQTGVVYTQIISDLTDAGNLLSTNYLQSDALTPYPIGTEERVRPTKWSAMALLARVYLYTGNWAAADEQSSSVINNSALYSLTDLNNTFLKNSAEAIWQLQPVGTGLQSNTGEGALLVLPPAGPNAFPNEVYLPEDLVKSFEVNDQRKTNWIDSVSVGSVTYYYSYKYKIGAADVSTQEYTMVLRLAEQYLIRAEAEAHGAGNGLSGAVHDLNIIRNRASLPNYTGAVLQDPVLAAIVRERRIEFFTEWGHRWFDLKRTKNIDAVMTTAAPNKGGSWSPYKSLYPIPRSEINADPNLIQNPGY